MKTRTAKPKVRRLAVKWQPREWSLPIRCGSVVVEASESLLQLRAMSLKSPKAAAFRRCKQSTAMKTAPRSYYLHRGFTLIELLVVIAIIAILAGILLPTFGKAKLRAQINSAGVEMQGVITAINQYYSEYSRFPASTNAVNAAIANGNSDFTYGTDTITYPGYRANNSEVMVILADMTHVHDAAGTAVATVNVNHNRNPRKIQFFDATKLGPDGVLRDPWDNPYIISMDFNHDNRTRDALYRRQSVSGDGSGNQGLNGLSRLPPLTGDTFELPGTIMMWSLGPDGQADTGPANQGVNRDNILSWTNQ